MILAASQISRYLCCIYALLVLRLCRKQFAYQYRKGMRMDFHFDWNYVASGAPYVTISELGLAFNSPAISLLNNPENVLVGFDKDQMAIGIMAANDNVNAKTYVFSSRARNGWVRIGCRDFVKHLSALSGLSFSPAKKFVASYDERQQILYITLNETKEVTDDYPTIE